MHGRRAVVILALALLTPLGCGGGGGAVDASGDYTLAVTNGSNGCGFQNWTEGDQSSGIPLTVTQDENDQVTATVGGLSGAFVSAVLGSNVFTGTVSGTHLDMTLHGTRSATQGNCTYTVNGDVSAHLNGDVIQGTIDYHASTNGSPDCGTLDGCTSEQEFNGTRPPSN